MKPIALLLPVTLALACAAPAQEKAVDAAVEYINRAVAAQKALGQPTPPPVPGVTAKPAKTTPTEPDPAFARFDLNFDGGAPGELVRQIRDATRQPLNVIIPTDLESTDLPALRLKYVTVPQLFEAIEQSSRKTIYQPNNPNNPFGAYGGQAYTATVTSYGFKTAAHPSPDCIWHFYYEKPVSPPATVQPSSAACRFYQLESHLNRGLNIDDITTALETAWKMMGEDDIPKLKFHQDTTLLIAVGQPEKLMLIEQVLTQLPGQQPGALDPATGLPLARPRPVRPNFNQLPNPQKPLPPESPKPPSKP